MKELITTDRNKAEWDERMLTGVQLIPSQQALNWARKVHATNRGFYWTGMTTEAGEKCNYWVMDGPNTVLLLPDLFVIYKALVAPLTDLLKEQVYTSAWPQSAINVNLMVGSSGTCGLHVDSNPLTVLLALSGGMSTDFQIDNGMVHAQPLPGYAHIFNGKRWPHRVEKNLINHGRIVIPFNYYIESDFSRPDWFDDYVYGNKSYGELNGEG